MISDLAAFAQDPAATQVLEWMRDGRWRKARDAAKDLCKRDRAKYLPLLVESNVGLVREMLGKGLVKEAGTVVDYLQTLAPAELIATLRAEMAAPPSKRTADDVVPGEGAVWWALALRVDGTAREISPADLAAVDQLVTDAYQPPVTGGDERAQQLAAELAAVRTACDATGDGRWDEAREALRALPRQSVFRHWRMFLRGVRCVFEDQEETARQCFGELPPGGALARAARAFDPGLLAAGPVAPATARIPFYLTATGQPAAWGGPILAASVAWKAGKRLKAIQEMHTGMKGIFPSQQAGLPAVLTEAVLPYRLGMDEADFELSGNVADYFGVFDKRKSRHDPAVLLTILRPMCVTDAGEIPPGDLDRNWRMVIDAWNRSEGKDPLRDSMAWQWLGEMLGKPVKESFGMTAFSRPPGPDFAKARKALDKAVECDPENEAAWLSLLALLERQGDAKTHNRLLGELVKRFPRNKSILVKAGNHALDRKTYDKSLAALRAALALDPLDKEVKQSMLIALVLQAREYARKARPVAPLWAEMEPLLEDRPGRGFPMLARWISRLRQSLLDPDAESARQAGAEALRLAPSTVERLFLEDSLAAAYRIAPRADWESEWEAELQRGGFGWGIFSNALDLLAFASQIKSWGWRENSRAGVWLLEALGVLLGGNPPQDPDGLLVFLDHWDSLQKGLTDHARHLFGLCMNEISHELEQSAPAGKRKVDPRLRLANLMLVVRGRGHLYLPKDKFLQDLDTVAKDAAALGMAAVVARVKALRERLEKAERDAAVQEPDDDWDEDEDENGFESAYFEDDDDLPAGAEDLEKLVKAYADAIMNGDERGLSKIRNSLSKLDFTEDEIRAAIKKVDLEITARPPPKPSGGYQKKPARRPANDPNQPDLF